jgi:hypothetical protein
MADISKRFEILILRPLDILFLVSAVFFLVKGMWWWFAGCVVGIIYLGIVGSKLHPFQSASDLAQGPIEGPAARIESELLPQKVKQMLVGHACTRVGILVGVTVGVISLAAFGWRWYFALLIGWIIMLISGALLKLAFKTI